MKPWLRLEWRELRRAGPGAWLFPWLAGAGLAILLPPTTGISALTALAAVLAVWTTARRLWRERHGGGLERLRLTPASTGRVLLGRLAARACILWLQVLPVPALALGHRVSLPAAVAGGPATASLWAGGPWWFAMGALLLPPALAVAAGVGGGAAVGLWVRGWRSLHLAAAALAAVLAAAALFL